MLIEAGANLDVRDNKGRSAIFFALEGPQARKCVALLLAAGCDMDADPAPGNSLERMSAALAIGRCDDVVRSERASREVAAIDQAAGPALAGVGPRMRI